MLVGAAAGVVATLSLAAFYRAMADAPMSLVAPITASGTAIPVLVGIASGEHLGALQLAGIVVTLAGIVLASGPEFRSGVAVRRQALGFAIGAAVGFGVAYTLLALAAGSERLRHPAVPADRRAARARPDRAAGRHPARRCG